MSGANLEPLAQSGRVFPMTPEAQSPDVGQIALTTPFGDRKNVVGIPETPTLCVQIQLAVQGLSFAGRNQLKPPVKLQCIQSANSTDASITLQDLLAQITRICSESPLMNAVVTTEGSSSRRYLLFAPAADAAAVRTPFFCFSNPASGSLPDRAHYFWDRSFLM
jgi:hypothetical protein